MRKYPHRLNHRRYTFALGLLVVTATATACGDETTAKAKPDTGEADDTEATDVADSVAVFRFDNDTVEGGGTDSGATGSGATDANATLADGASSQRGPDADAADVGTPQDTGPVVLTSCKGKCGLYLEGNPCHCSAACEAEGNCCADFAVMCTCKVNKDCDDGNVCTTDSCQGGTCKQIPFQNCCASNAECKGSTACKTATCLDGSCTLLPKNCEDGLACTVDVCDEQDGKCAHKLPPTKCLIDGFCAQAGDKKPGSSGCELCQPDIDPENWTAKAGTCVIAGKCYESGTENPEVSCQVCDASASGDSWSVKSGHCWIGAECFVSGQNPSGGASCAVCKPSADKLGWSGTPGTCAVATGGSVTCLKKGDPGPSGSCAVCDPDKSTAGYTLQPGWCLIADKCVKGGTTGLADESCSTCDPATNTNGWSAKKAGEKCDDGDACTDGTLCNKSGKCVGKTLPGCCQSDADCDHLKQQAKACELPVCLKGSGKCELQKLSADKCCTDGKCCDAASQTVLPIGTKCSDFKAGLEYRCDGKNVEKREMFPGCSGVHGKECKTGPEFQAGGPWQLVKTCGEKQTCDFVSKASQPNCK